MPDVEPIRRDTKVRIRRVWTDIPLLVWNLLIVIGSPILLFLKVRRYWITRNRSEFDLGRWSVTPPTPELAKELLAKPGQHVVFVGQSFGEMLLMEKLAESVLKRGDVKVTLCIRDRVSIGNVRKFRPEQAIAIWPFDFIIPVAKWLQIHQPDVLVFTERFRFHNFVCASAKFGTKVAVINGRCRRRESGFHRLFGFYYRWFFGAFRGFFMQSEEFRQAAAAFAPRTAELRNTGNVKFDLERKELPADQARSLEDWLAQGNPILILAAGSSSSPEEEQMVLAAFRQVRLEVPCRLLLAPRRIQRRDEINQWLAKEGMQTSLRTENQPDADVYLLDTLGELSFAYQFCAAAYVGGAYDGEGHNVAEPLEWGIPVSYGMRRGHFETMQLLCESVEASARIANAEELAAHWKKMLSQPEVGQAMGRRGKAMLDQQRGSFDRTLQALNELIDAPIANLSYPNPQSSPELPI